MIAANIHTIIGDPHVTTKNLDKMSKVLSMVEALGNPTVFLGDLLDTKSVIQGKCLNFWMDYFKKSKLYHVLLVGNHDYFSAVECKDHALRIFDNLNNVAVVNALSHTADKKIYAMPYMKDDNAFKAAIKKVPKDSVLFCHADVRDFDYGYGVVHQGEVTAEAFNRFRRAISGHYHMYQEHDRLTYLGTPFSKNFSESNQTKYIATYNVAEDSLELIPTNLPQHRTIEVDCDVTAHLSLEHAQDLYRIILVGTQANVEKFDQALIQDQHTTNVVFVKNPTNLDVKQHSITELDSPEKQFTEWGTIHKLSEQALKLGLSILGEVKC